jgi:hypothetical protein
MVLFKFIDLKGRLRWAGLVLSDQEEVLTDLARVEDNRIFEKRRLESYIFPILLKVQVHYFHDLRRSAMENDFF